MRLVKLEDRHGNTVYFNPDHLSTIQRPSPNVFEVSVGLEKFEFNRTHELNTLEKFVNYLMNKGAKKTKV